VSRSGTTFSITAGTQRGSNLFHSFTEFSVPTNNTATFSGSASVQNIIGRVTGDSASSINGTLRSTIAGANLYLINPHGVSFGASAHLDVSGSVHVSTADYVSLGPSDRFYASTQSGSTFSSASPAAFGFLAAQPAPISVAGSTLNLASGAKLELAAGDITLSNATVNAPAGQVDLTGFGAVSILNSRIMLNGLSGAGGMSVRGDSLSVTNSQIRSPNSSGTAGGSFSADVTGALSIAGSVVQFEAFSSGDAGNVSIRGGRIAITGNSLVSTATVGQGHGGEIAISGTEELTLSGGTRITSGTLGPLSNDSGNISLSAPVITVDAASVTASTSGGGHAGNIDVSGGRIVIANQGIVDSSTKGAGDAGNVHVSASESLDISGIDILHGSRGGLYSTTIGFFATGDAGSITVETPALTMSQAGEILSTSELGGGDAGSISLRVGRLEMTGGARVSTSTFSAGNGGLLDVLATGSIVISGTAASGEQTALRSNANGAGRGGVINVQARDLRLEAGGSITSSTYAGGDAGVVNVQAERIDITSGANIASFTQGAGNAGPVSVQASDMIRISSSGTTGGILSNAVGTIGNGGSVLVSAPIILMSDLGAIQSVTDTAGNGGNVTIRAGQLTLTGGSQIGTTTLAGGNAGSINVFASESVVISGDLSKFASGLLSNSQGAARGDAGNVTIETPLLVVRNGGFITSETEGPGKAGDVTARVGELRLESGGQLLARTYGRGDAGNVTVIASGNVSISGTDAFGEPSALLSRTDARGNAGRVSVTAANMFISGLSGLSSESSGRGNAGEIVVALSGRLEMRDDAQIATASEFTTGGNITIRAKDLVYLKNGVIITRVAHGGGNGGNIVIDPEFVVIDHGFIVANAVDGNGGNITIVANNFLNNGGTIEATSQKGISGNIVIRSPVVDATGALVQLQGGFFDASKLMRESCAARAGRDASRFTTAPRGGLALAPQNEGAPRGAPSTSSYQVRSSCAG
jgi:filamentous hemagglutinin family protein